MHLNNALNLASFALIASTPASASVHDLLARAAGSHLNLVRDIRTSLQNAGLPSTLKYPRRRNKKRDSNTAQQFCRIRPSLGLANQDRDDGSNDTGSSPSSGNGPNPTSPSNPTSTPGGNPEDQIDSPWKVTQSHEGSTFFDKWEFWAFSDPTHGVVEYQNADSSWSSGLVEVNDAGNAIIRVDTTQNIEGGRRAVRLHDTHIFTGGLVILDAIHMPTGCGTWPAFWTNGPNWPYNGEIDILEGVHSDTINQASIHTGSGCHITEDTSPSAATVYGGTNCASYESGNSGCGQRDAAPNNYGAPFNTAGGGVYAMLWDDSGIKVWFFTRSEVPVDITSGRPLPDTWHRPAAFWRSDQCNPWQFFKDHHAIINTTFCGDWAGSDGSWSGTGCAASTGYSTCADYVRQNGDKFRDAYWEVKSVKIYNKA